MSTRTMAALVSLGVAFGACTASPAPRPSGPVVLGVLTDSTGSLHGCGRAVAALSRALAAPLTVGERTFRISASVGLAVMLAPVDVPVLLGWVDGAMYRSKHLRRPVVWEPGYDETTRHKVGARPATRTSDLDRARLAPSEAPLVRSGRWSR